MPLLCTLTQVMAVTDNSFLITAGFAQIFTAFTLFYDVTAHVLVAYTQAYVWPLVHITQLGTVWITVLISFNRFVAICLPFRAHTLCSFRRVRNQVNVLDANQVLTFSGHAPINTLSRRVITSHPFISCVDACFFFNCYRRFLFYPYSFVVFRMLWIFWFIFLVPCFCSTFCVCQHVS